MPRCDILKRDVERGYCKRDPESGHVLSPVGGGLNRYRGANLKERLDEYHRINPGHDSDNQPSRSKQVPTSSMLWETVGSAQPTYTVEGRKNGGETLEEIRLRLYNKEKEQEEQNEPDFQGVVQQKRLTRYGRKSQENTTSSGVKEVQETQKAPEKSIAERMIEEELRNKEATRKEASGGENGRLGTYGPSVAPTAAPQRRDPLFKSQNALYDSSASQRVLEKILDGPVTVTAREILAISSEVSKLMKDANTTHKVPNDQVPKTSQKMPIIVPAQMSVLMDESSEDIEPANLGTDLLDNTAVVNDSFLAYYNATGGLPKGAVTAVVSEAIRAVRPTIAQRRTVEALIDPGCSIVSMSDALCRELALLYDPGIVLPLQSANGQVNHTLGLAPNVPFTFGDITLYLQVHIVENPPFEVLLGRPFDRLTKVIARTYQDGSQGLTITDPNSGRKVTVPSYDRNDPVHQRESAQGRRKTNGDDERKPF